MTAPVAAVASYASDLQQLLGAADPLEGRADRGRARPGPPERLLLPLRPAERRAPGGGRRGCRRSSTCRRSSGSATSTRGWPSATSPGWWQRMVIRKGARLRHPRRRPRRLRGGVVGPDLGGPRLHLGRRADQQPGPSDRGRRRRRHAAGQLPGRREPGLRPPPGASSSSCRWTSTQAPRRRSGSPPRGSAGYYPPGLTIGQIVHVESSEDGLFKTGEVALDPRLAELTEVTVLVPAGPGP